MGLIASFISLLTGAAFCFGLAQIGVTRRLALLAALATGLAAIGVIANPLETIPAEPLSSIGALSLVLPAAPDLSERAIAVVLLVGGTLGLLALAVVVPPEVEGFGALFGWLLLALTAALLSLTIPPLSFLTPLSWTLAVIAAHGALIAAGVDPAPDQLPPHLIAGGLAVVAVTGLIAASAALPPDTLPPTTLVGLALFGALALAGAPPFGGARSAFTAAPALVAALITGLTLPTIGLGFVVRLLPQIPPLPVSTGFIMAAIGAFGALGAAFNALNAQSGRDLVARHGALQAGVVVCAAALNEPLAGLAAPALLLSLQMHAVAGGLVSAAIERLQGSDLLDGKQPTSQLPFIGLIWLMTTATATGLPLTWSFWGWRWLMEAATSHHVWVIGPLITAAVIGFAAGLPLLMRCWQGKTPVHTYWPEGMLSLPILIPLILAGFVPWLAWPLWLSWSPFAPPVMPAEPLAWPFIGTAIATGVISWFLLRKPNPYQTERVPEDPAVSPTWQGMGELLQGMSELADARRLFSILGRGIDRASSSLHTIMIIFEQRYYLFGVMIGLLAILFLMAQ